MQETSISSDYFATLAMATASFRGQTSERRPSAKAVIAALLQAEKAAKQQRLTYPFDLLLGSWRLCFVSGTRKARHRSGIVLGNGFYVPRVASAQISFYRQSQAESGLGNGEISNQIQFGPLLFQLTGPAQYLGKKNLLAFDFTQMRLCLFGQTIYKGGFRGGKAKTEDFAQQSIAKLPFFAFFLVTQGFAGGSSSDFLEQAQNFIAARGRGGGLALWSRE
ncbi:MAG: hypothetical protein JO235_11460 [Chroococcidiopsidaceae cyanobacterium CP_BM_RX_35]|nr:hypothetical protein [Chroococcidiopsidaceae cyanobacterium CP_BM_RX_35]